LLWWFQQRFGDHITLETSFPKDLKEDSLDVAEFLMELEEEWGIQIPDELYGQIKTVRDAMRLVKPPD
jgi:acyl carrier protein